MEGTKVIAILGASYSECSLHSYRITL